jgi:hypothetical protein
MLKSSKILLILTLTISIFAIISCDSANVEVPTAESPNRDRTGQTKEGGEAGSKMKIKSSDGKLVAEINQSGQIEFGGKILSKKQKNADKVIYSLDGNEFAEVKAKDADGFKVRELNGKLLWKIKISADKIKISDNEENTNAFEIRKNEGGIKVEQNETPIGKVKFNPVSKKVKIKDAAEKELFESLTDSQSFAYGVLLLDKIPETQRFIIISELFARNL